jgi:transmembrane sensor
MKPGDHNEGQVKTAERIAYLIAGFIKHTLSKKETDELDAWLESSQENLELFEELTDPNYIGQALSFRDSLDRKGALEKIKKDAGLTLRTRPFFHSLWVYGVAACLLVAVLLFLVLRAPVDTNHSRYFSRIEEPSAPKPGSDKAVLTLAGGRTIILDSTGSGQLAREGNVQIEKHGAGEISYQGEGSSSTQYNQVSIPRGGQFRIVLSDGTKVYLNAESSLRFPVGFAQGNREVELRGEAYFEVARNPRRPFLVKAFSPQGDSSLVRVLGTHFNVNAYSDEGAVTTTLIEGSLMVEARGQKQLLTPGQQAQVSKEILVVPVQVENEIAWTQGEFFYSGATMRVIASDLARWYDLEVEYRGNVPDHFNARIQRREPLSSILHILEATNRVHFNLEGKKLTIQP